MTRSVKAQFFRRLLRGISHITVMQVLSMFAGLAIISLLARRLSAIEVGLYFIMIQIGTIAAMVSRMGLEDGLQKYFSEALVQRASALSLLLRHTAVLAAAGVAVVSVVVSLVWYPVCHYVFQSATLRDLLLYQILVIAVMTAERLTSAMLRAFDRMLASSANEAFVRHAVMLGLLVGVIAVGGAKLDLKLVFLLWVIGGSVNALFGVFWTLRTLRVVQGQPGQEPAGADAGVNFGWRPLLKTSASIGVANAAAQLRANSELLIIGWLLGPAASGIYGPVKRFANLFAMALNAMNKMLSPIVATLNVQARSDELESICRRCASLSTLLSLPLFLLVLFFGSDLLGLLFGESYQRGNVVLLVLSAGLLVRSAIGPAPVVLNMLGHSLVTMKVNIAFSVAALVLYSVSAYYFNVMGVAVTSSALLGLQFLVLSLLLRRITGIRSYVGIS